MLLFKFATKLRALSWYITGIFLILNFIAFWHAYKFTHFSESTNLKTASPEKLSNLEKIGIAILGVSNPKPINKSFPTFSKFSTHILNSNKKIECWLIPNNKPKGTVIMFHGYSSCKSSFLEHANILHNNGYEIFLVDFMGCGGSEGNQTTIGFYEYEQVYSAFQFISKRQQNPIFLYGSSMGAVAIMKCLDKLNLNISGIILECPFGSMYQTTAARFKNMGLPSIPMAGFLVFWGGIQNNFWAFSHNPSTYAKAIRCPTLLLYGLKDPNVSKEEIKTIFNNLKGNKRLVTFPKSGHENYLIKHKNKWTKNVVDFLGFTK